MALRQINQPVAFVGKDMAVQWGLLSVDTGDETLFLTCLLPRPSTGFRPSKRRTGNNSRRGSGQETIPDH